MPPATVVLWCPATGQQMGVSWRHSSTVLLAKCGLHMGSGLSTHKHRQIPSYTLTMMQTMNDTTNYGSQKQQDYQHEPTGHVPMPEGYRGS